MIQTFQKTFIFEWTEPGEIKERLISLNHSGSEQWPSEARLLWQLSSTAITAVQLADKLMAWVKGLEAARE